MRRMKDKSGIIAVLAVVLFFGAFLAGCENFEKNTYRTLLIMGHSYDTGMKCFRELYDKGVVGEEAKVKGMEVAQAYHTSFHGAVNALEAYHNVRIAASNMGEVIDAKELAIVALNECIVWFGKLAELLNPYLVAGGHQPMTLEK